jgi:hypothetical protein
MSDIWHSDILDKVVHQLGDNLLDKLFAHLSTTTSLSSELINEDADAMGFPSAAE